MSSRDIQKCNCFGYSQWVFRLCSQSSISRANGDRRSQAFEKHVAVAVSSTLPQKTNKQTKKNKTEKHAFLDQSLDPPIKNSWIRPWIVIALWWRVYCKELKSAYYLAYYILSLTPLLLAVSRIWMFSVVSVLFCKASFLPCYTLLFPNVLFISYRSF